MLAMKQRQSFCGTWQSCTKRYLLLSIIRHALKIISKDFNDILVARDLLKVTLYITSLDSYFERSFKIIQLHS